MRAITDDDDRNLVEAHYVGNDRSSEAEPFPVKSHCVEHRVSRPFDVLASRLDSQERHSMALSGFGKDDTSLEDIG